MTYKVWFTPPSFSSPLSQSGHVGMGNLCSTLLGFPFSKSLLMEWGREKRIKVVKAEDLNASLHNTVFFSKNPSRFFGKYYWSPIVLHSAQDAEMEKTPLLS